jgi:exoribonuclease R
MKLYTKDYLKFKLLDENGLTVKEIIGVEHVKRALPGDEVDDNCNIIKRAEYPLIVGIVHLQSKTKYGMTSRGVTIYLFEPLNKAYPLMIVGSTEKDTSTNVIGLVRFEAWEEYSKYPRASMVSIVGPCGDLTVERESLLLRYSPWKYPKAFEISPGYANALRTRPLLKGFTFNIDPPGCEDVDDIFTLEKLDPDNWALTVSITDVATAIEAGSVLDLYAQKVGQSLYPNGASPKHMLPPKLSTKELSLLPDKERNCISLRSVWSTTFATQVGEPQLILTKASVDKAYTYAEAQEEEREEFRVMKHITQAIAKKYIPTSEELVEALMIYYNNEVGKLLKKANTGILRSHNAPDQERLQRWEAIDPTLKMLAYSAATYVPGDKEALHWGLGLDNYAHASSPLRRYADLYNQRCLLKILQGESVLETKEVTCTGLNQLQKDAKSFERDSFFLHALADTRWRPVHATLLEVNDEKQAIQCWVPSWNRVIRVRCSLLDGSIKPRDGSQPFTIAIGQTVYLSYHIQWQNARWKDKIIFSVSSTPP